MLGFRKLHDVPAGILERDELTAKRQRYRFVETSFPAALGHPASIGSLTNSILDD
jgi:hypothetical protein